MGDDGQRLDATYLRRLIPHMADDLVEQNVAKLRIHGLYSLGQLRRVNRAELLDHCGLSLESGVAALRAQCAAAGIVVYERVIQRLLRYPDLILRLSGCIYPELYIKLYDAAHQRLGSSTKAAVVAVDRNRNVVITDVVVTSSSKSDFYYAFDECKPCFLKLSKEPNTVAMLEREAQIYETARLRAPDGLSSLVPVELIELEDPRPLFVGRGGINVLKMQIYVRTVSNCVFDPRLSQLFVRVGIEVLKAISALHEVGFVHCDVKPSNIFISSMGTVHLGDYDATTELGLLVNRSTERYMPEPYRTQFNTGTLRASPALDKAMLMLTLLECLGIQLSPDLQIDRAIDEAAEEVETFRNRGGSHSPAVMAIETAKGDIVEMLRSLHQSI